MIKLKILKTISIALVVIAMAVIVALPATAQMRMRGGYGRGHYHPVDITKLRALDLTDEQITKLKILREDHLREIMPIEDQMFNKTLELKVLWLEQTPDINKLSSAQKEIQSFQQEMYEKTMTYRNGIRSILTDQQQKILWSHRGRHHGGFGPQKEGDKQCR